MIRVGGAPIFYARVNSRALLARLLALFVLDLAGQFILERGNRRRVGLGLLAGGRLSARGARAARAARAAGRGQRIGQQLIGVGLIRRRRLRGRRRLRSRRDRDRFLGDRGLGGSVHRRGGRRRRFLGLLRLLTLLGLLGHDPIVAGRGGVVR